MMNNVNENTSNVNNNSNVNDRKVVVVFSSLGDLLELLGDYETKPDLEQVRREWIDRGGQGLVDIRYEGE